MPTLLRINFLQQAVSMTPLIHQVEYETNINTYAASKLTVEVDVARKAILVAIKS